MTDTNELTGEHAKLASVLKGEFGDRISAAQKQAEENAGAILRISEGVEAITEKMKSREHHGAAYVDGADDAFETDDPAKKFSLHRGMIGWSYGWDWEKTPYAKEANSNLWPERDILEAATTKAQSAGVDTEGGFAVPEQFNSEFIPILLARSIAAQLGVPFRTDFRGSPVTWPRIDTASQAYWVAENVAPTESDTELGQISMTPHDLSALIPVSNRLMFQTSGGFESMLRDHMARIHAIELDRAFFKGTGAAGEPLGLDNVAGTGTVNWDDLDNVIQITSTADATDLLSEMIETVDTANALEGSLGFAAHPQIAHLFRQIKDTQGMPILGSGNVDDRSGARNLYGYNFLTSTQLTASATSDLYFGNWADALIGQWGTMVIDSSNVAGNAFFRRQTYIRANMTVDVAFMHEASFCLSTNLDSTP